MQDSTWKDWFGAEVGFSLYVHRRGFTSPSTINHQSVYLPPNACRPVGRVGAPYGTHPARHTRARRTRLASSHQHAGQPHHTGVTHPLVAGSIYAPAGDCGVRGPKRSTVARSVASMHGVKENARRPNLKPMRKPRPGSGPCPTPSTWLSSRHIGAKSGARGATGRMAGEAGLGSEPSHAIPHPPCQDGGQELLRPSWQQTRETGPRVRLERSGD